MGPKTLLHPVPDKRWAVLKHYGVDNIRWLYVKCTNIVALPLTTLPVVLKVPHESSYQTPVPRPVP
jgi:hypothetical protein